MPVPKRVIIYTRDVMNITGKSYSNSAHLLRTIRKHFNKSKRAFVTVEDFCHYTGLKESLIEKHLK